MSREEYQKDEFSLRQQTEAEFQRENLPRAVPQLEYPKCQICARHQTALHYPDITPQLKNLIISNWRRHREAKH